MQSGRKPLERDGQSWETWDTVFVSKFFLLGRLQIGGIMASAFPCMWDNIPTNVNYYLGNWLSQLK